MIKVSARARRHEDRAGDPLDGLVNLFDVGIVLAVAFLLAALSYLHLAKTITSSGSLSRPRDAITVAPKDVVRTAPTGGARTAGEGTEVGKVYRTRDGRLIYVIPSGAANPSSVPSAAPSS